MVDLEQKSERVQCLILQILSNVLDIGSNYLIQTPSFLTNHIKLNASKLPNKLYFENNLFTLPSFCELTNNELDCVDKAVILKVKF